MKPIKVQRWAVIEPSGRVWVDNRPQAIRGETERAFAGQMDRVVRVEIRELPPKGKKR